LFAPRQCGKKGQQMAARFGLSRKTSRALFAGWVATQLAWGCGDSTEERLTAAGLSESCSINTDCRDPLVCVFERCHEACEADRDCPPSQRCVLGPSEDLNVCQLPDEVDCVNDKDCPGEQVCGIDDECRDPCETDGDCTPTQICANSGECASTDPGRDSLDDEGNILGAGGQSGSGGQRGTGGNGGSLGRAGGRGSGDAGAGDAGEGGSPSSGSSGDGGSSNDGDGGSSNDGDGGSPTGSAAGGEGGSVAGGEAGMGGATENEPDTYVETSDGIETIENNDRDHTVPMPSMASIYLPAGDEDWFSVQVPDDGRAHVLEIGVAQAATLRAGLDVQAGADFSLVGAPQTFAQGVTTTVFATVGPGSTTLLRFFIFAGTGRADLTLNVVAENDAYEPNNERTEARSIPLNSDISAQFMVPYTSAGDNAIDDWYAVDLSAGAATVNLLANPDSGRFTLSVVTSLNTVISSDTPTPGQLGSFGVTIPSAGTYFVHFARFSGFDTIATGAKPAHMGEEYVFRVEQ
jgi:hypothetical protein